MTMHGTIMVFFVLTTAPFAAFGNFFLPIQTGGRRHALPAFQHDVVLGHLRGLLALVASFFVSDGPPWVAGRSTPLSAIGSAGGPGEGWGVILLGQLRLVFSALASCWAVLNFITTTLDMRCKGMSLMRSPLTAWAWFLTSVMGLAAFAVLMPATSSLFSITSPEPVSSWLRTW